MIKIGSLFSGIGGFELGLERAIPNSKTIWQVEQNKFCQKVLKKHWPDAKIYDEVKNITAHNVEPIDILCGGFPCQDISVAGKGKGINEGKKSSLWWEMLRIICDLRPRIVVMENVPAITFRGLDDVLCSLAKIGLDAEWEIISAKQEGACHLRERWFCVAYSNESLDKRRTEMEISMGKIRKRKLQRTIRGNFMSATTNIQNRSYWKEISGIAPLCGVDDGLSQGLDKTRLKLKEKHRQESLKAFGNAIVPQCSEYIGSCILKSGLLEGLK